MAAQITLTSRRLLCAWLCGLAAILILASGATAATGLTLKVTTTSDTDPSGVGNCAVGGTCSLREAVNQANTDTGDTISVPAGSYGLNPGAGFGQLVLTSSASVTGAGAATTTISGNNATRIFVIPISAVVSISGLTLEDGNASGDRGGAILIETGGVLTVSNCVLTGNMDVNGGGAIDDQGALTVQDSTITGNGNPTSGRGGGIEVVNFSMASPTSATISNSTLSGNHAVGGAGLEVQNFTSGTGNVAVTVTSSALTGNTASGSGGGVEDTVVSHPANLSISDSTIAGNTAMNSGGGVALESDSAVQNFSGDTIDGNTVIVNFGSGGDVSVGAGGAAQFANTIVAAGTAATGPDCSAPVISAGHNLDDGNGCGFTAGGDLTGVDPKVGPLQNNGGPSETMALLAGSPAIDAGSNALCAATDQRGVSRPQGSGCDIGAYESARPLPGSPAVQAVSSGGASIGVDVAEPDAQAGTVSLQYGTTTAYGSTTPAQTLPAFTSATPYEFAVSGLAASTTYHFRVVAADPDGIVLGPDQTLTTAPPPPVPTVKTLAAGSIGQSTATLHASVNPNGGATTAFFQYSTSRSLTSAKSTAPQVVTAGVSAVRVSENLSGLSGGKKYYFRVEATNTATGVRVAGAVVSFTTLKRINATMVWAFPLFKKFGTLTQLLVLQAPVGGNVTVICKGKGCPYSKRTTSVRAPKVKCSGKKCKPKKPPSTASVDLSGPFRHRHLALGTVLTVRITETDAIGKAYVFKIGNGVQPKIGCLAPGSTQPGRGC